jgi:hypothetical protein
MRNHPTISNQELHGSEKSGNLQNVEGINKENANSIQVGSGRMSNDIGKVTSV